jgi:hypothetical protein
VVRFPLPESSTKVQLVRYAAALVLVLGLSMCGCTSSDEVLRITSPDGRVDAIVFETNCGAPCSFVYEIWLAPRGARHGVEVAFVDAAVRNEKAWGVNLKWLGTDRLAVEYFRADHSQLMKPSIEVAGDRIEVFLHDGVQDPRAPAGGMEYNLHKRP